MLSKALKVIGFIHLILDLVVILETISIWRRFKEWDHAL